MICSSSDLTESAMKTTARPKLAEQRAQYEAWYEVQVRLGLEDIEAGRIVSHDEVAKRSAELLGELRKKHAPKAA
jgi:predicted transcriptional regulator